MDKLERVVDQIIDELDGYIATMRAPHFISELKRAIMLDPSLLESLGLEELGIVSVSKADD